MKRDTKAMRLMVFIALVIGLAPGLFAQAGPPDPYAKLLAFEYGQSWEAFWTIENQIREAGPDEKRAIETRLVEALKSPKATAAARQSITRLLIGTASCESVPVLKEMLTDKELGDSARSALQGLTCPEVDEAFRAALPRLEGRARLAMIAAMGERRNADALGVLKTLLTDPDAPTVRAALAAIGRIGGEKAAETIATASLPTGLQGARADALLQSAESLSASHPASAAPIYRSLLESDDPAVQAAAYHGAIKAAPHQAGTIISEGLKHSRIQVRQAVIAALNQLPAPEFTDALVRALPGVTADTQVAVVTALGLRADPKGLPAVISLLQSPDRNVQVAAIEATARFGDHSCVVPLFGVAKAPDPVGRSAVESLRLLKGDGVETEVAKYLTSQDASLRVVAVRTLTARRDPGARAAAFDMLKDAAETPRVEAWKSLGLVGRSADLDRTVALLLKLSEGREQQAAEQAVQAIAERVPPESRLQPLLTRLQGSTPAERSSLLRTLGRIGGDRAFEAVRSALKDRDAMVQDTAVRVLSDWGDQGTAPDLLSLAGKAQNPVHRILGLRGYVRLAAARPQAAEQIQMLQSAIKLADGAIEKRLVLGALSGVEAPEALDLIEPYLADAALKGEAESACLKVALAIRQQDHARAVATLRKLAASSEPSIKEQADEALKELAN